jgi:hypothetical protein
LSSLLASPSRFSVHRFSLSRSAFVIPNHSVGRVDWPAGRPS